MNRSRSPFECFSVHVRYRKGHLPGNVADVDGQLNVASSMLFPDQGHPFALALLCVWLTGKPHFSFSRIDLFLGVFLGAALLSALFAEKPLLGAYQELQLKIIRMIED